MSDSEGLCEYFSKKVVKRFGGSEICRTFAIPNSSGGGEMVDTLL